MDKVCNMCGDIGISEELVTCSRCKKTSEHTYCMDERRKKIPVLWYCEECLKCRSVIHKEIKGKSKKKKTVSCNTSDFKNSEGLGKRSLRVDMNQARNSIIHNGMENKSKKQMVVYGDCNEFNLKSSESTAKRSLGDGTNQTKAADGTAHAWSSEYALTKQHVSNDKDSKKQEMKDSGIASHSQTLQPPLPFTRNQDEKLSTSHHALEACWKGTFKIFEVLYHDYKGIRAHLPYVLCPKVEKISKELPKTVTFKKVLPRRQVWPKIFQLEPPTKEDIGLYFFPSEQERFKGRYTRLLKRLDDHDFALQACIKDTQLLIFSSNQLPKDSRRILGEPYLWGIFRHMKRKEPSKHTGLKSLSTPTATKPVDIHMTSDDGYKSSEHPKGNNLTFSLEENRWLYVLASSKTCAKFYSPSENLPSSSTLESLCHSSDNHSSSNHRVVKVEMFEDEKIQKRATFTPRIDPDVPPGFSEPPTTGFSTVKTKCPQFTSLGGGAESTLESLCRSSDNHSSSNHGVVKVEMFEGEKIQKRATFTPRIDPDVPPGFSELPTTGFSTVKTKCPQFASLGGGAESTLESLCRSSDNHSSSNHGVVKVEMFDDEKIQKRATFTPRIDPDVPPGFCQLPTTGFSAVKTKCPQASENWCKSAEPSEGNTLICSTENRESCTELHPTSDNLPSSPTMENVCGLSGTSSKMHKTKALEMLGGEKNDRRDTSITRVHIMSDSLKTYSEKNRRDASMTRADTVPSSSEANLEKSKPPIRFVLKKAPSPIHASVPQCFLVGKTKELKDSSKGPCPLEVDGKDIVSSPNVERHAAKAPKDCHVQSKGPKATDCGQRSAEHPASRSFHYHVEERKGFGSFASPDEHRTHQSIIKNPSLSASRLPLKKKAHCELSPSLNLESISAVKKMLLQYKEKREISERDRQVLKSEKLTCDKEKNVVS